MKEKYDFWNTIYELFAGLAWAFLSILGAFAVGIFLIALYEMVR